VPRLSRGQPPVQRDTVKGLCHQRELAINAACDFLEVFNSAIGFVAVNSALLGLKAYKTFLLRRLSDAARILGLPAEALGRSR
jgi:hypothetical protein